MDVAHSFLKSHSLNVQNLLTAHITLFFYRRYERIGSKLPGKRGLFHFHIKRYDLAVSIIRCRIGGKSSSLICQSLHINFSVDHSVLEALRLCQHGAVLCDQILSAKYQILGGFTLSCCGVNIAAHQSGRLTLHQITAIGILAYHLITSRKTII